MKIEYVLFVVLFLYIFLKINKNYTEHADSSGASLQVSFTTPDSAGNPDATIKTIQLYTVECPKGTCDPKLLITDYTTLGSTNAQANTKKYISGQFINDDKTQSPIPLNTKVSGQFVFNKSVLTPGSSYNFGIYIQASDGVTGNLSYLSTPVQVPSSCETTSCKVDTDCPAPCGIPSSKYDRYMCDFKISRCTLASLVDYNNFDAVMQVPVENDLAYNTYYFKDTYVWLYVEEDTEYYTLKRVNEVFPALPISIFPIDAALYDNNGVYNFFKGDTLYTLKTSSSTPVVSKITASGNWPPDPTDNSNIFNPTASTPIQSAAFNMKSTTYYFIINNTLYKKEVGSTKKVKYVGKLNSSDGWSGLPGTFLEKSSKLIMYWDYSNFYYYFYYGDNYVRFKYGGNTSTTPTITPIPVWKANK